MPLDLQEPVAWAAGAATSAPDEAKPGARGGAVQPAQRRSPQPAQGGAARAAPTGGVTTAPGGAGGNDGSPAAMVANFRRLEQRLEAERRHVDRQVQRLERRVEEVASASSAGGRWAELQGYVDGLAETVQGLVRGAEDGGWPQSTLGAPARTAAGTALQNGLAVQNAPQSAAGLASQNAALEVLRCRDEALSEQLSDMAARLLDMGSRLVRTELGLEHLVEAADSARCNSHVGARAQQALQSDGGQVERLQNDLHDLTTRLLSVERGVLVTAEAEPSDCDGVRAPLWEAEGSLMPSGSEGEGIGEDLDAGFSVEDLQDRVGDLYEQVALVRGELEDQVADLGGRVHDAEQSLQDLAHSQEMRSQVNHVNEQVMRLALRTQRAARSQDACEEDLRALRGEMGTYSDELGGLWMRVEGTECGVESLTAALDRVCEELADLRARASPTGRSRKGEAAAGDWEDEKKPEKENHRAKAAAWKAFARDEALEAEEEEEGDVNGPSDVADLAEHRSGERPPLRNKVQEVERGLESMAEVVWDLRKQVSGMRSRVGGPQAALDMSQEIAAGEET